MDRAQEVYDLIDKIEAPIGQNLIILKNRKGEYVSNLDQKQQLLLGQEISKQIFPNGKERYTLLPLQKSHDSVHSNLKEDKEFKEINKSNWFHNREVLKKEGKILPDPVVYEVEGELKYDGKQIPAKINEGDIFDTLIKAGLFKESEQKPKIYHGGIDFDDNGDSSVRSHWSAAEGCFDALASRPSSRYSLGLVALGKTKEKPEIQRIEIAKREYDALQRDSKRLKELMPIVNELESTLKKYK